MSAQRPKVLDLSLDAEHTGEPVVFGSLDGYLTAIADVAPGIHNAVATIAEFLYTPKATNETSVIDRGMRVPSGCEVIKGGIIAHSFEDYR
jgi:hypothetical protein